MSVHQKKNGTWFVQYRLPGERSPRREYIGVGPEAKQQALIRDAEVKLEKARGGRSPSPAQRAYLDAIAQDYLIDRKVARASESWRKEVAALLNKTILPALCHKPVDELTHTEVMRFADKAWGHLKAISRQRYMGYLRAIFRFGVAHELCTKNPLAKWKTHKEARHDVRLTVEDMEKLLAFAAPHLAWAIEVEWELGTRPGRSELFALRWDDVDFAGCKIRIPGTKTHASNRIIPIRAEFRDRLQEVMDQRGGVFIVEYKGKPVSNVLKALQSAASKAKLPYRVRMYDIRHLFASTMLAGGADLAAVSKLLGHTNISTTQQHYYQLLKGEMERAINARPTLTGRK